MAFSLPMPTKKFWLFAGVVLLLVIGLLWKMGNDNKTSPKTSLGKQINTEEVSLEDQVKNIQNLVLTKIAQDGTLTEFKTSSLPKNYQSSQLKTVNLENREVIKAYASAISSTLSDYDKPRDNEAGLVIKAIDNKDASLLIPLITSKAKYEATVKSLSVMKVPKSASSIHLVIINSLQKMSSLLTLMQQALSEPALALQASQEYLKANLEFALSLKLLNQYFQKQNLTFSEQEQIKINPTGQ